jgi:hypothetical protein
MYVKSDTFVQKELYQCVTCRCLYCGGFSLTISELQDKIETGQIYSRAEQQQPHSLTVDTKWRKHFHRPTQYSLRHTIYTLPQT